VRFDKTPPRRIRIELYEGDDAGSSPGLCEDAFGRLKDLRRGTLRLEQRIGMESVECLVVGAGVIAVESESGIGAGVSSRNSEVIPAGICYRTGVDKTLLCVEGKAMLYAFCQDSEFRTSASRLAPPGYKATFAAGNTCFVETYQLPNRLCSTRANKRGACVDRHRQRGPSILTGRPSAPCQNALQPPGRLHRGCC
jgi:hypothetical protein